MKKIAFTICFWAMLWGVNAQNKMDRDLKIFKTMLEDFINKNESNVFSRKSIAVKYYEGFGVIVQMPPLGTGWKHWDFFSTNDIVVGDEKIFFSPDWDGGAFKLRGKTSFGIESEARKNKNLEKNKNSKEHRQAIKAHEKAMKEHEKAMEKHGKIMKEHGKTIKDLQQQRQARQETILKKQDSLLTLERAENDEKVKKFLTEYADLLTELKPNEKIRVLYSQSSYSKIMAITWNDEEKGPSTTKFSGDQQDPKGVEVLKTDIDAFKSGKINEKIFLERIKNIPQQKATDQTHLEVLAGVLDKLIDNTQEKSSIRQIGKTKMFYLEGFGVEYETKLMTNLNGTGSIGDGAFYKIMINDKGHKNISIDLGKVDITENTQGKADKAIEEGMKKIKEQEKQVASRLPEFEKEIEKKGAEYLLLYGKTLLPFLKNNEKITWTVDIASPRLFLEKTKENEKNDVSAKQMIFTISRQTLEKYDNKQISLEQATKEVKFEKR